MTATDADILWIAVTCCLFVAAYVFLWAIARASANRERYEEWAMREHEARRRCLRGEGRP